jgi:predicted TIM-barrel fold metal-dependent hydrolase
LAGKLARQIRDVAETCPKLLFDLSEIVAWVGASNAPTREELVRLVRDIGVDRVMFGSDFPWYDPGVMARTVRELADFSTMEQAAILGENAARLLSLAL